MYPISITSTFNLDFALQTEEPCELYVDTIPDTPKKIKRILWVFEPNEISKIREKIISNKDSFDLILTYDETILSTCNNSKLFLHGITWIRNFDFKTPKEFCVTTLIGGKSYSRGHLLRHSLFEIKDKIISIPLHIFNSKNVPYPKAEKMRYIKEDIWKNELFYSQFHIAIENNSSKNYFTEKIIDCFQTKTIPIYFGCNNIGDFFDSRGIFNVSSVDEIVEVCNSLTSNTYEIMKKYVDINYSKSLEYVDFKDRLVKEIKHLLNE